MELSLVHAIINLRFANFGLRASICSRWLGKTFENLFDELVKVDIVIDARSII